MRETAHSSHSTLSTSASTPGTYRVTVVYASGRVWRVYGLSLWEAIEAKEATMQQAGAVAGYCISELGGAQ